MSSPSKPKKHGTAQLKRINAVSYTKVTDFEECPHRAFLKYVEKVPEPERPLPPGKTEHANDRGTRIHNDAELFVKGEGAITSELKYFEEELTQAQGFYKAGQASLEGNWGFNVQWVPCDFFSQDVMLRTKLDLCVHLDPEHVLVVDYKTGKKFGNEIKHAEQLQMYAIATLAKYPRVKIVTCELWYLDHDDITSVTYTREQIMTLQPRFERRIHTVMRADTFPKRANKFSCRWCPYAWFNNGPCQEGIKS